MLTKADCESAVATLNQLKQRWMIGQNELHKVEALPAPWQALLGEMPSEKQQLAALAVSQQFEALLLTSAKPEKIKSKSALPTLSLPLIDEHLRPLCRRLLANVHKQSMISLARLLHLLTERGVSVHPADWLPTARDDELPAVYFPWVRWVADANAQADEQDDVLSQDNWDEFYPAERLALLRQLRFNNSAEARELIATCAASEPADKRLKIIEVLAINLGEEDVELLNSLTAERSRKIANLAQVYLARLGHREVLESDEASAENAKDLAEGFDLKKVGVLKKALKLQPKTLKSSKQKSIRSELLQKVPAMALAQAINISTSELAKAWQFSENREGDNINFLINAVEWLGDEPLQLLLQNLLQQCAKSETIVPLLQIILPRVPQAQRESLMSELWQKSAVNLRFYQCLSFLEKPLRGLEFSQLTKTSAWKNLIKNAQVDAQENGYVREHQLAQELIALGFIVPQPIAEQIIKTCLEMGMLAADPALDSLKLNSLIKGTPT